MPFFIPSSGSSELSFTWRKLPWEEVSTGGKDSALSWEGTREKPLRKAQKLSSFLFSILRKIYKTETKANTKRSWGHAFPTNLLGILSLFGSWHHSPSSNHSVLFSPLLACCFPVMTLVQLSTLTVLFPTPVQLRTLLPWHHFRNDPLTQNPGHCHHFRIVSRMFTGKSHCIQRNKICEV